MTARSWFLRDIERAESRAAEALGTIHVLDRRRWQHVMAWCHRPHDIGDRESRRILAVALERGDKTIIAIFGMGRRNIALDPRQRVDGAAVEEIGIVDLE